MGFLPWPPIPPSEARDGELHKLRYLGQVEPDRLVQKGYGDLFTLSILASVAFIAIGGAVYLGLLAQSEAHVNLTDLVTTWGPSRNNGDPAYPFRDATYRFDLMNSGTRGAIVQVDLYANGERIGWTDPITVMAGTTVPTVQTGVSYTCGPETATAVIVSSSPIA